MTNNITLAAFRPYFLLFGFVVAKFFLQFHLISPDYDLHRDEYLHLDQSNHLAWGYDSVPPVTSWISSLISWLGKTVFWVKFFPALFGVLTLVIVWATVRTLGGGLYAQMAAMTSVLLSTLLRINTLYQPNSLDILCWVAVYYFSARYLATHNARWLYVVAIVLAIGFLNKYNIVFLVIGLLPALASFESRKVFSQRPLYYAILLFLVLVSPNIWWQYVNGFPVWIHMRELTDTQLVHVSRSGFLRSQIMYFLGGLPLLIAGWYGLVCYRAFVPFRPLLLAAFFTLTTFFLLRAKSYYAIGLYPIFIAFGSVFIMRIMGSGIVRQFRIVFVMLPIVFFVPMYQYVFPNRDPSYIVANREHYAALGLLRWEDGKKHDIPQDFADMLGWRELASQVDSAYAQMAKIGPVLVLCDNYGQAGAINYYTKEGVRAVSFSADYLHWFDLSVDYVHFIRVKNKDGYQRELTETSPFFERSWIVGAVANRYAREHGTVILAFVNSKVDINAFLAEEIETQKQQRRASR